MKQKLKMFDEFEVIAARGRWRRRYTVLQRPGRCAEIKTRLNRRTRHHASQSIREGRYE